LAAAAAMMVANSVRPENPDCRRRRAQPSCGAGASGRREEERAAKAFDSVRIAVSVAA
jgi:hypothetical protein